MQSRTVELDSAMNSQARDAYFSTTSDWRNNYAFHFATPTQSKGEAQMRIGQSMIPELDMEMANTRKVLERIPDEKLDWKIHDKSNTIGWVANHLADIPGWVDMTIRRDAFDVEPVPGELYQSPTEQTTEAILNLFDKNVAQARTLLESVEDATLHETWRLLRQGEEIVAMPRLAMLRTWVLNHSIHHRAHLCVYLRVNEIPVPGLYGPSADEPGM